MENILFKYSDFFQDDGGMQKVKTDFFQLSEDLKSEARKLKKELSDSFTIDNVEGLAKIEAKVEELAKSKETLKTAEKQLLEVEKEIIKANELESASIDKKNQKTKESYTAIEKLVIEMEQHRYALKTVNQLEKEGKISVEEATIARNRAKDMMKNLSAEITLQTKLEKAKQVIDNESLNTLTEVRERMSALRLVVQNTNITTEEGKKTVAKYNEEINTLTDVLGENSDKFIQNKINVGNYEESIKNALKSTTLFGVNLGEVGENLNKSKEVFSNIKADLSGFTTQLRNSASATNGLSVAQRASAVASTLFSGALKVLKLALISTGIGAILVLLGSLVSYFSSSQDGADKLTQIMEPLKAIFQAFQGVLSNVGRYLVSIFENPKKALKEFGEFIKQNLINRFTALGDIIQGIFTLDFKKVGNGVLQATTGVENLTGKIQATAKATKEFLDEAIRKGKEIADLNILIGRQQVSFQRSTREITNAIEDQLLISKDVSKGFPARKKAVDEIIRLTEKLGKEEANIVKLKIKALDLAIANKGVANKTLEDEKAREDLLDQLDDAEDRGYDARIENLKVIAGFKKEEHQKELDRIKALQELRIREANIELQLFLAKQGYGNKSFEEQISIEEQVKIRKLKILKEENDAGKFLKKEYEAKKLEVENEFGAKSTALVTKIIEYETNLRVKASETLLSNTKAVNDNLLKAEIERINTVQKTRLESANLLKFLGQITERELQDKILEIDKETKALITKANVDFQKNNLELRKSQLDEQNKVELDAVNSKINELSKTDVSGLSKRQRDKTLQKLEEFELEKSKIDSKYKILRGEQRIEDINKEISEVEKGSIREIELTAEKNKILADNDKIKQDQRITDLKNANKTAEEIYKEFTDTVKGIINDVFKAIEDSNKKQIQSQEKLVAKQNELVDKQSQRAQEGLSNTLAFEQRQLAEREAELIKSQKKQERLEKIKALYTSYTNYSNKGDENPILKALRDFAILESITASFGDGGVVEDKLPTNGIFRGQSHNGNKGGIPILVEGREGIFSAREMENLGKDNFYRMKEIAGLGRVDSNFFSGQRQQFIQAVVPANNDALLLRELNEVKKAIESKPVQNWDVVKVADGVIEIVETLHQKNKTIRNHYKTKKPRL